MSQSKARFVSYLTQAVRDDKSKRQPSFKSYIDNGTELDGLQADSNDVEIEETASEFFDMELQPGMLPGERLIGKADSVLKFTPYSEGRQGMSGKLCATNFKISFVTADRSSYELPGKRQRNKLLAESDIPLTAIDAIYQITSSGKRKRLIQGMTTSSQTKTLEIHCKDFRIHTFGFKFTPKDQNKQFINVIVHHAFVTKDSLLFAHEYGKSVVSGAERRFLVNAPTFDCMSDWEEELRRCNCEKNWRVTDVNLSFEMAQTLPKYFVVYISLFNNDLNKAAPQFCNRRIPTWCYSHTNGNSLLRMGSLDENTEQGNLQQRIVADTLIYSTPSANRVDPNETAPTGAVSSGSTLFANTSNHVTMRMLDSVKAAGKHRNNPTVMDLAEHCPSCKDIQESYSKLKRLCMSDTEREFVLQDLTWHSSLDDTKWLQYVAQCLKVSMEAAEVILDKKRSVVIQEKSGCDFSCLVASVVQIMLDPYYRSQAGFQALIQKEWVRMGHPFQTYLNMVRKGDTEQTPIFLLFLDCVWQMLQQFPSCFEFTETFLTTLWDTAHIGIFDTFLFDNDHQREHFFRGDSKNIRRYILPPAWKWDMQFSSEDLTFFKNPLYILTHESDLAEPLKDLKYLSLPGARSQSVRGSNNYTYSKKLNTTIFDDSNQKLSLDILSVQYNAPVIHLWTQCFIRWQAPAQILSGGSPSSYLQQCHMVEEIIQMQHKAELLKQRNSSRGFRPRSDLIFGHEQKTDNVTQLLNSTYITSSFPFSPGPTMKDQQILSFTPTISMYMRNSSLEFEKFMEEDD